MATDSSLRGRAAKGAEVTRIKTLGDFFKLLATTPEDIDDEKPGIEDRFIPQEEMQALVFLDEDRRLIIRLADMRDPTNYVVVPAESVIQIAKHLGVLFEAQSNAPAISKEYH